MTSLGGMIYVLTKSATEHHCLIKDHWKTHISRYWGSLWCPSDTLQYNLCKAGKRMWLMGLGVGAFCEGYWGLGVGVVAFQVGLSLSPGPPLCHGNEPWRGKRGDQASSLFPTFFNPLLNFQLNPFWIRFLLMFFFLRNYFLTCSPHGSYWPGRQVELLVVNHCHLSACFHSSFSSTISSKLLYQNTTKLNFKMTNWGCRQSPASLLQSCECHISAEAGFLHKQNSKMQRAR